MWSVKGIHFGHAMLAIVMSVALLACQQGSSPAGGKTAESGAPETKPGLVLTGGVLMLPIVEGRPGAAYFRLENGGGKPVSLAGVYVEGAGSAEMHETRAGSMAKIDTLELGPGDTVTFERGGLHVMAFDLSPDLAEGRTLQTEITLTFSDGDKLSAPLAVEKMGTAMDEAMSGHEH